MTTHHTLTSPFPFPRRAANGRNIVDERCQCDHLRSDHYDTFSYGYGDCGTDGCHCIKFSWKEFILDNGGKL
jgi:hypothetical protein